MVEKTLEELSSMGFEPFEVSYAGYSWFKREENVIFATEISKGIYDIHNYEKLRQDEA
ncbi:hypothetical protein GOV04_05310 [Candidatus Woesearchaeota archaeon]|nr:hypothetical protein [Candidatus Woesearchaeota archaeon]